SRRSRPPGRPDRGPDSDRQPAPGRTGSRTGRTGEERPTVVRGTARPSVAAAAPVDLDRVLRGRRPDDWVLDLGQAADEGVALVAGVDTPRQSSELVVRAEERLEAD